MKATDKQIKFILYLADRKGLNTTWMNAGWKKVGVPLSARNGRVVDFLANLNVSEASNLIDRLQALSE